MIDPRTIDRVDSLLSRSACELVLDPAGRKRELRDLLAGAAAALAGAGLDALAALATAAAGAGSDDVSDAFARLESSWTDWKATGLTGGAATVDVEGRGTTPDAREAKPSDGSDPDELIMLGADPELAAMFIGEALDHLSSIEALVLQVEAEPGNAGLLDDVFRPFHTIKGNAGALGVTSVQALAHSVENLLDLGRSGQHHIGGEEIEAILAAVDLLTTMVRALSRRLGGEPVPDSGPACRALIARVDALAAGGSPAAELSKANGDSAAPVPRDHRAPAAPGASSGQAALAVARQAAAGRPARVARADDSLQNVKVDTRKLDSLIDIVGELVIVQSIISEDPALRRAVDERLSRNLAQLERITTDLQRTAMAMRMTPIRPTFQKMSRLVRDLGRKSGKPIDLVVAGEDTELDRKVVEDITDPLMHMIRNSVDHGIESPERRRAAGKPLPARVELRAYHEGGNIVVAIADDGAGLDTGRIRAKAVAQGLIGEDQPLSPPEIHELIFRPGFSTAEHVTEISGRGVGMDVVRRNIEALRGRIEIQSAAGAGTTFLIRLPLTLAILEGLLLRTGSQRFVLPTFSVRESLRPARAQVHAFKGRRRLIQVRDSLLPMAHLSELLGEPGTLPEPWDATVVVIDDNGRRLGLMVDELLGKQEVVVKALGGTFAHVRGVAGGAILGDGRVGLILDAGGLVSLLDEPLAQAA